MNKIKMPIHLTKGYLENERNIRNEMIATHLKTIAREQIERLEGKKRKRVIKLPSGRELDNFSNIIYNHALQEQIDYWKKVLKQK